MAINDTIADMLTRIRNAALQKSSTVSLPTSKMNEAIAKILTTEGFIEGFTVTAAEGSSYKTLTINLKYYDGQSVIRGIKRISTPGLRIHVTADKLPKVNNGLGIAIVTTSHGVMTDKQARKLRCGGEVLAYVW